jgi:hypothetical protein
VVQSTISEVTVKQEESVVNTISSITMRMEYK